MCQSSAYLKKDGKEDLIMEDVDYFETSDEGISLVNIFGEQKNIKARVKYLYLVDHKIVLESV